MEANEGEALTAAATGGAAFQPMKVADVPESVLETNGTLKRNTLFFGCTATNCQKPTDAMAGKFAVRTNVRKDGKDGEFSKRDKLTCLASFKSLVGGHHKRHHCGGCAVNVAATTRVLTMGASMAQAAGKTAAASKAAGTASVAATYALAKAGLTPAEESPDTVALRMPFGGEADRRTSMIKFKDLEKVRTDNAMVCEGVFDILRRIEEKVMHDRALSSPLFASVPSVVKVVSLYDAMWLLSGARSKQPLDELQKPDGAFDRLIKMINVNPLECELISFGISEPNTPQRGAVGAKAELRGALRLVLAVRARQDRQGHPP